MPGPTPKPPERRQRTNSHAAAVIPFRATPVDAPPLPAGLLAVTRELWRAFWRSPLAQAVEKNTDTSAIVRYFTLADERERMYRGFRRKRLVLGSQGQKVLNPMGRALHAFDAELRQLEDRLGMSPRSRLQLGVAIGEAAKSLAELNRILEEDDDGEEDTDPRQ
jgi:P27 family predicted phage terminase small subunit